MTDPGIQLLALIDARVARGEDRHSAKAAVMRENRTLVAAWHGASAQEPGAPAAVDPGAALLSAIAACERTGMDRRAAQQRVLAKFPALARAYHAGAMVPRSAPSRPRLPASGPERRLPSDDPRHLRRGETMVHKLAAVGGGFFAVAA